MQSEYLRGDSQLQNAAGPGAPPLGTLRRRQIGSYYASLGYLFTPKLEGVLRYDTFEFDRDLADTLVRDFTLGLNYYIKGNNAKIQLNLVRRSGAAGLTPANNFASGITNNFLNDRTELRTNFQVGF